MNDGQTGITYDDRSYKVTVVVTDDGKGNLVANVTWPNGTPPTFKNTYTKPVPAVTPGTPGKPPVRFAKRAMRRCPSHVWQPWRFLPRAQSALQRSVRFAKGRREMRGSS